MLNRCGAGCAVFEFAFRLPRELLPDPPLPAFSRFLSDSFFSRCSRWMGGGAGVLDCPRELAGFSGDGAMGVYWVKSFAGCNGVGEFEIMLLSAILVAVPDVIYSRVSTRLKKEVRPRTEAR